MILFELRCSEQHHFEAWFKDGAAYDAQVAAGAITCPQCGDRAISKAIMAPRIAKASPKTLEAQKTARSIRQALVEMKRQVQETCAYVGSDFPEQARKIHYGEVEAAPIYGEATPQQVDELQDEGIAIQHIPWVTSEN